MGVLPALNTFSLPDRDGSHLVESQGWLTVYDVLALSAFPVFFCPLPGCVPPFVTLQSALLTGPYRHHLLEWNCVMVPEYHKD